MEKDYDNFFPPYMDYSQIPQKNNFEYNDPFMDPIMHYEQRYTYYKFLCMQLEYKMKCKEYDKLYRNNSSNEINSRKP